MTTPTTTSAKTKGRNCLFKSKHLVIIIIFKVSSYCLLTSKSSTDGYFFLFDTDIADAIRYNTFTFNNYRRPINLYWYFYGNTMNALETAFYTQKGYPPPPPRIIFCLHPCINHSTTYYSHCTKGLPVWSVHCICVTQKGTRISVGIVRGIRLHLHRYC